MVGFYKPPYDTFVRMLANGATMDALCSDPTLSKFMFTPDGKQFYRSMQEEGAGDATARKVDLLPLRIQAWQVLCASYGQN